MRPVTSADSGHKLLVMIFDTPLPAAPSATLQSFPPGFMSSVMGFTPNFKDGIRARCSVRAGEISCFSDLGALPQTDEDKACVHIEAIDKKSAFWCGLA